MREIKFRGKRTKTEDPLERWIEGSYIEYTNIRGEKIVRIMSESGYMNDVDPNTVGQFTGLKDKNGKEIYEGDILQGYYNSKHEVCFSDTIGAFILDEIPSTGYVEVIGYFDMRDFHIIDNIHDNKNLLGDRV